MSAAKEIQAAEALSTKAAQKELGKDYDAAFELHVKAAQTFLHLARTLPEADALAKASCKAAAGKALERAEQIKKVKKDVKPVATDPYSAQEQAYILDKSSLVNGLRYSIWQDADSQDAGGPAVFCDPDGQPAFAPIQQVESVSWRRPVSIFPQPLRMSDTTLLPEDVAQSVVTDCSVVAAIAVCLGHHRRFGSKLGISSLYTQDGNGLPLVSKNGRYAVRVLVNGTWRKSVIDDTLPFLTDGRLLGVSAGESNVLWPPLLEKAYMKLMGGYDFPGSNSGTDLHTLVGWIPEHIHIRSAEFRMEGTWTRVLEGFSKGECLVTLGTPPASNDRSLDNLLPAHNYAVIDMHDDGSERYITLLDPWRSREQNPQLKLSSTGLELESHISENVSQRPTAFMRLAWRDTCMRFDTIHLNWDPSLFSRRLYIHGLWKPSQSTSKHSRPVSNRIRVFVKGAKTRDEEVWVLLTRHIVGKLKAPDYISLNVVLHDEFQTMPSVDKLSLQGTYSDSVHVLRRFFPGTRDSKISIVASLDGADVDVGFTITVLSPMEVQLDTQPQTGFHSKTVEGSLTSSSSGGNFTYPTFMTNPQYRLQLQANPSGGRGHENAKAPFRFSVEGPKDLPLNVKIVWSKGQRITELVEGDVVADTGAYSYGVAYGEMDLKAGEYTLVVSSFEPRQQGPFELSLHSMRSFDLELIPREGAGMYTKRIRGAWDRESSAGSPSFGRYNSNPIIDVSVPSATQIMIRVQLLNSSPSLALNATLFATDAGGGLGRQVLTSGPYSDAIAGVLIPRDAIAPGKYLLVPSTYASGVEAGFQVFLYSTGTHVEMSWSRGH